MRGGFRERMMIWGGGALLLALGLVARAAEVRAMRIDPTPDFTRVTFELSGPLDYKLFAIANPDRIVLDLHAARFAAGFAAPAGDGLLKGVRTGQRDPGDLRVVFDLDHGVRPQSFLLPPNEDGGYRLVVDLYKKEKSRIAAVKNARALEAKPRDVVVASDAGHGGVDPGAIGAGGAREKNITLAVARDLKRLIDRQPGMSAVLTRDGDYFLPLKERYQKARAAKADLFISIHADAYTSGDASGSSVWMLSPRGASSEAARWLAERENRADLVGGVSLENKMIRSPRCCWTCRRAPRSRRVARSPSRCCVRSPESARPIAATSRRRTSSCCVRPTCRRSWSRPRSSPTRPRSGA